jgi:hypothetical protein
MLDVKSSLEGALKNGITLSQFKKTNSIYYSKNIGGIIRKQ